MNTPKDCSDFQALFTEYADRELDQEALEHLTGHLDFCAHCAQEWRYFEKTMASVRELGLVAPPANFLAGVHAKLDKPGLLQRLFDWLAQIDLSMSIPTATATVAIALTAAVLFKHLPQNQPVSPPAAVHEASRTQKTVQIARPQIPPPLPLAQLASTGPRNAPFFKYPSGKISMNGNAADRNLFDTYMNLHTTPVEPLFKDSTVQNQLKPDMLITIETPTPKSQRALYNSLMKGGNWQAHLYDNNMLLLFMNPKSLPELHNTLAQHNVALYPPEAAISLLNSEKNMLTVAIRLQ